MEHFLRKLYRIFQNKVLSNISKGNADLVKVKLQAKFYDELCESYNSGRTILKIFINPVKVLILIRLLPTLSYV